MKRSLAITFLAIYGLFSLGLSVHLHYCKGELKHFSLFTEIVTCCDSQPDDCCAVSPNCCSTEDLRIALDDEHQSPTKKLENKDINSFVIPSSEQVFLTIGQEEGVAQETRGSPPPDESSLYLNYCRLTYYG